MGRALSGRGPYSLSAARPLSPPTPPRDGNAFPPDPADDWYH
jgi:hypothetical protein